MSADETSLRVALPSADERRSLEQSWAAGRLAAHVERLLAFVTRHRDEIIRLAGPSPRPEALHAAAKHLILQVGSIHPRSEMDDQVREIRDEIWYCGERGDYDSEKIKHNWTSRHAANWRAWRLKEYFFVADQIAPQIVALLRSPDPM